LNRNYVGQALSVLAIVANFCLPGCRAQRGAPPAPPPPVVTVTQPVVHPVQTYFEYNGHLDAVEMVQIVARVEGVLKDIAFTEGDEVNEGDLLFEIDPREYAATIKKVQADKLKAVAELKRAQADETRVKALRTSGAMTAEEFDQRVASRETAEAVVLQTEAALESANIQLGYTKVYSPIKGQISRTLITRGNIVGTNGNTLLTSVVSMDPLYIFFDAPERDLVEYQRDLKAGAGNEVVGQAFRVEVGVATEEGYPHVGRIDFRENRVDVGTGTVRVRGIIPNPRTGPADARLLYPGLFARVRIPSGAPRPLPAIPEDALMTGQEGRFVYVLGADNVVQKRTVTVGPQIWKGEAGEGKPRWTLVAEAAKAVTPVDGATPDASKTLSADVAVPSIVSIESGLTKDDVIVINGLTKARPGAPVDPQKLILRPPPVEAESR